MEIIKRNFSTKTLEQRLDFIKSELTPQELAAPVESCVLCIMQCDEQSYHINNSDASIRSLIHIVDTTSRDFWDIYRNHDGPSFKGGGVAHSLTSVLPL